LWGQKGSHWWACTNISGLPPAPESTGRPDLNSTVGLMTALASGDRVMNPPDAVNTDCNKYARHAFSSAHTGGVHFVLGDGSVRFVSENIDASTGTATQPVANYRTYARLLGVNDGLPLGEF
jgi:hypothetical protein